MQNGLDADGKIGKNTLAAINKIKSSNQGKGLSPLAASVAYHLGETT